MDPCHFLAGSSVSGRRAGTRDRELTDAFYEAHGWHGFETIARWRRLLGRVRLRKDDTRGRRPTFAQRAQGG